MKRQEPDVEITAAIRADELRFECKPEVRVVGYADAPAAASSVSERENLPDALKQEVTYRDFAIRWRATAHLTEADSGGKAVDTKGPGSREIAGSADH